MAAQVGAALWHMPEFFGWFAFQAPGHAAAFAIDFHGPGFVLVNAAGQRFGDETGYEVHERLRALVDVKPALGYAAAAAGRDERFGRRAEYMAGLDLTDLYAIELWPAVATTSGGPRRDARSRVVRPDGTTVPGLYAAGGAGSVWGPFTQSGGGLTDALVFGRLAGREAAQAIPARAS